MSEKDYSPLSLACVKSLSDNSYDKRQQAASEIEKMVKDFASTKNTEQIRKLLKVLGQDVADDVTMSQMTNRRKGGIIGLAATAMALGKDSANYMDELILPILHCFGDSDSRARYDACEALYNVTEVARGAILVHFNEIFNALSKLAADPDQNVKSRMEMLDRLLKDIVTESSSFDLVPIMPLLRERMYTKNTFARQFVISWISVLHAVPDINMVIFLPELLDGLFNILEDQTMDIKEMCENVLGEFLRDIIKNPTAADFSSMINILIVHSQPRDDLLQSSNFKQLMAVTWIKEFVDLAGHEMLPYASEILVAVLPCLAYDDDARKNIRETSKAVNYSLMKLITNYSDDDRVNSNDVQPDPQQDPEKSVDLNSVIDVLTRNLQGTAVPTKVAVLQWIYHLHFKMGDQMFKYVDETFPVLLKTLSDPSDEVVLLSLEVLVEIVSFSGGNEEGKYNCNVSNLHVQNNTYFGKFITSLLGLFETDKQLLEDRGAFIVRQLCVLLSAEEIYRSISEILIKEDSFKFATAVVETLNTVLLTSAELFELRTQLKELKTRESCSLFTCLYRTWAHDPVATVALCLLTQNYSHACDIIRTFGQIEVTLNPPFLVEVDNLVQLMESPIFTYLRLDLLDGHHNTELIQALYGLLMLLPQSEGFHVLQRRLNCVPSFHLPPGSKLHGSPKIDERVFVKEIRFDELLNHFKTVQERHRKAKQASKVVECSFNNRVDVGLQTDEYDDPDVYYFAGGRTIACQTDSCEQYEPLILLPSGPSPVIIVLDPSDSVSETSLIMDTSMTLTEPNTCDSLSCGSKLNGSTTPVTTDPSSPVLGQASQILTETCVDCTIITTINSNSINNDTSVSQVVETKSSATQLSIGVLIGDTAESTPPNDGSGDYSPRLIDGQSMCRKPDPVKTTFADKARNGMLRQTSMQAKSVPINMNKIGTVSSSKGNASGGGQKGKAPIYRSNIASRCRTAVNTNKQQVVSPVKSKLCTSFSSSAGLVNPTTTTKFNSSSDQSNSNKSFWNSKCSGQTKSPTSSNSCSTKRTTFPSNNLSPGKTFEPSKAEADAKRAGPGNPNMTRQGSVVSKAGDTRNSDSRSGMVRSKSMINPPSITPRRTGPNNNANQSRINSGKKSSDAKIMQKQQESNNSNMESKNKNFVSLPDVSVHRKRNSTVDEDGWETVRARSNRSKWSPSGSSLSIPLTAENYTNANGSNSTTAINCNGGTHLHWKEEHDSEVREDEEIKKKDEDLDNAIREEELIEEELRQVEKDFEMIENESRDGATTSENDNAPSPDGINPMAEMDVEKEQFFFICMDAEAGGKSEEFPPREPGRIVALREKLMSPAKRCDGAETLRKYQAKLAKAERNREKLLQAKYNRYVELSERFEALNETTKKLVNEREELIAKAEAKLQRAAENRKQHLQNIVKKAHDEDAKAKEIAFINLLEAQNKRHDYLATAHEIEGRLQTIQEERRLKLEERASKALSVIERQSRIRCNWQSKLERMQEKRRKAEERITREKEEKAKERSELAQEKARDREERISALNAAKQAEKEELQKKIQQKQEDTARRHEENMEQIRQKAIELSVPRTQEDNSVPATVRVCTLCKVSLPSEVQELAHLRGRAHIDAVKKAENFNSNCTTMLESFGLKYVCDLQMDKIDFKVQVDRNRFKVLKKHCKKLMQKLFDSGLEYEKLEHESEIIKPLDPDLKAKIHKSVRELDRLITLFENKKGTPAIATNMGRLMTEIRKTSVKNKSIKDTVIGLGAVAVALRIIKCSANDLPDKIKIAACNLLIGINYDSQPNIIYCLRSTAICVIVEFCAERLNVLIPEGSRWIAGTALTAAEQIPSDPVIESLLELLFTIINIVPDPFHGIGKEGVMDAQTLNQVKTRVLDIIGYFVASGVIDRFSIYCSAVRGPIEDQIGVADLLKMILDFLVMIIYALHFCWTASLASGKKETDTTQLLAALESSELGGAVSMSYTLLLYQGAPTRPRMTPGIIETEIQPVPPPPGERTSSIVRSTLLLINAMARLDHPALQNVLGSEAVSLQFRHIASQLLWQVVPHRSDGNMRRLLNELLIAIAYFTVGNRHNQVTIQSGQTPTVLQQLCTLPQEFFNDIKYIKILFPTLISATYGCPENIEILVQHNIDLKALDAFMHSHHAANNDVLLKLKFTPTSKITDMIYENGNSEENQKHNEINGNGEFHSNQLIMNGQAATDVRS